MTIFSIYEDKDKANSRQLQIYCHFSPRSGQVYSLIGGPCRPLTVLFDLIGEKLRSGKRTTHLHTISWTINNIIHDINAEIRENIVDNLSNKRNIPIFALDKNAEIRKNYASIMYIERNFYLNKLIDRQENGRIKVITGIRRCGKSVLLFDLFRDYLKKSGVQDEQIIAIKLDIGINARYRNPMELDIYIRNRIPNSVKQYYVLLDEIQEVRPIQNPWLDDKNETIGFVDILLGLMELKNVDVYVTGSNSKMLSSDIITEFKDRGDEIHIGPLMYKEFYNAYENDKIHAWQEFITYGGLPRILSEKTDDDKIKYLQDLIRKTYLTDVLDRNHLQNNISVLDDLLNIVASCIGSLTNPTKLENTFFSIKQKKISDSTISTYLDLFAEAYILRKTYQYDIKGKKYIGTPLKYYFTDIGLRNAQLNFRQQEENHIMENVLYNELCTRGFNIDIGVVEYNYKDNEGKSKRSRLEVDFVVNKGNKRCYIQSAFAIPNEEKRLQETHSLRRINDSYKKVVVLRDNIKPWYDENGIYFIGIEDFLLNYIDELAKML